MTRSQIPSKVAEIELSEWSEATPLSHPCLRGVTFRGDPAAQSLVAKLERQLQIREGYAGIEIRTSSFVGRIDIAGLRISVMPKLPDLPLSILLAYAYGLRDLAFAGAVESPVEQWGLQDILVELLAAELEELTHSGLFRQYVSLSESLPSPRGRIRFDQIARRGGVLDAALPCDYFSRDPNWYLNRVLRTGCEIAAGFTEYLPLEQQMRRIAASFGHVDAVRVLRPEDVSRAERDLTRLTESAQPALELIRLLLDGMGIGFQSDEDQARMRGFFFDMNTFFQRLISRFLRENLPAGSIVDERAIRDMYRCEPGPARRKVPRPRPDFAFFVGKQLRGYMDAKYRDIWERGLPAEWLYQLSVYALASPTNASVLLYASTVDESIPERIAIRQPMAGSAEPIAAVVLRPVHLRRMAELVHPVARLTADQERKQLAAALVQPA